MRLRSLAHLSRANIIAHERKDEKRKERERKNKKTKIESATSVAIVLSKGKKIGKRTIANKIRIRSQDPKIRRELVNVM